MKVIRLFALEPRDVIIIFNIKPLMKVPETRPRSSVVGPIKQSKHEKRDNGIGNAKSRHRLRSHTAKPGSP
jgi:hypothetical protein